MMRFTLGWLAFHITGSPLSLGYVALFQAIPTIALTMVGGVLADQRDKRQVIIATQVVATLVAGTLAFLTITDRVELWHLIVTSFLIGATQSLEGPSRVSLYPQLLPDRSQLPNAVTVVSGVWQFSNVGAPTIGGFVIAYAGAGNSLVLSALAFVVMAVTIRLVRVARVQQPASTNPLETLLEGARYCWRENLVRVLIGLGFFSGLFAFSFPLLLPIFAEDILHVDARGLGILAAAAGVGSVAGTFGTPMLAHRFHVGNLIVVELVLMSGFLVAFAFSSWYLVSVALMVPIGFMGYSNVTLIAILIQTVVPDELRGRVMGVQSLRWTLMPLGAAVLAIASNFIGAPLALAVGAILVGVIAAMVGIASTHLRRLQMLTSPLAIRQGEPLG